MNIRVFLDANILIAATKSPTGGSRLVMELGKIGKIELVTVAHALLEAERNVELKLGLSFLPSYYSLLLESGATVQPISSATLKEISTLNQFVPRKDVPILLGALYSKCTILLTLDRRDLLDNASLKDMQFPFEILTPGEFLQKFIQTK